MNLTLDIEKLGKSINNLVDDSSHRTRLLTYFAAAVTTADKEVILDCLRQGKRRNIPREDFYEIILQSYLFLGFPRMLIAADYLQEVYPHDYSENQTRAVSGEEARDWFENGIQLYRRVYGLKNERLQERVEKMAPEIFRWMIVEGYGKVLSRPGLEVEIRELCIVAMLMMENRPKQLHSHMLGALNVGVSRELLAGVIDDIGLAAGDGYGSALDILKGMENGS